MIKDQKGVTIAILVVVIIVMIILAGITITTSDLLLKDTKRKTIVSNMYMVKAQVEAIYDEYQFSDDIGVLKGAVAKNDEVKGYGVTVADTDLWYTWDKTILEELSLDPNILTGTARYIVNYDTGEIIYTDGYKNDNGVMEYTLTDLVAKD